MAVHNPLPLFTPPLVEGLNKPHIPTETCFLTKEDRHAQFLDYTAQVGGSDTQKKLLEGIKEIVCTIQKVRKSFSEIGELLQELGNDKLIAEWEKSCSTYEESVSDSRRVATKAGTVANDVSTTFLDFLSKREVDIEAKRVEMAAYKKRIESSLGAAEAKQLTNKFSGLKRSIGTFKLKWNKEIKSERNKLSNDLKEAEEEVNLIEEKLNSIKAETNKLVLLLSGSCALTVAVLIGILVAPIAIPVFLAASVTLAEGGMHFIQGLQDSRKQLNDLTKEHKKAMDRLEAVQSANDAGTKSLESAEKQGSIHLEEVIRGVQNFTNVWQLISNEIAAIEQEIELMGTDNYELLCQRIEKTRPLYTMLAEALRHYANAIPDE